MISPTTGGWRIFLNSAPNNRATTTITAMSMKTIAAISSGFMLAIIGPGTSRIAPPYVSSLELNPNQTEVLQAMGTSACRRTEPRRARLHTIRRATEEGWDEPHRGLHVGSIARRWEPR